MHQILSAIASDLRIQQLKNESISRYEARIIYSAMAQHIKTASLDKSIYERLYSNGASIVHINKRCCDILEQLLLCSDSAKEWFEKETMLNVEIIHDRLVASGEMLKYFDKNSIVSERKSFLIKDNCYYRRGIADNYINKKASGLSLVEEKKMKESDETSISELTPFSFESAIDFWKRYLHSIEWEELYSFEDLAIFNPKTKSKAVYDCFSETTVIPEGYSLAEKRLYSSDYNFYVLKNKNGKILYHQIEEYYKTTKEHYRFRYALRYLSDNPVMAEYAVNEQVIELHLNTLLPNTEMAFLNLIAWPKNNINDRLNYLFSVEYFDMINEILGNLNVKLTEKKYAAV